MLDRDVFLFLDNEAARFAIVKGYSPVLTAAQLIGEAWLEFASCGAAVWVPRAPSGSNPADAPSRLEACPGWVRVAVEVPLAMGNTADWFGAGK